MTFSDAPQNALEILQGLLDQMSVAIFDCDLNRLDELFCLPYRRHFLNEDVLIETAEDMKTEIGMFSSSVKALGANQLIYLASQAERISETYISGRYTTHILRNAMPVVDSYENQVIIQLRPMQGWGIQEVHHGFHAPSFPINLVRVPITPPALPKSPQDDARRLAMDAKSIYQRYLDRTAAVVAAGDFDAYAELMHFPYTAHGSAHDLQISGPDDLRPFYEVLRRCHNGEVGDRIERIAERAEFIGSDLICGYHTGTVYLKEKETVAPVHSRMILKRGGTDWRLQSVTNSINNTEYPFNMYEPGGVLRTDLELRKTSGRLE